MAVLARSSITLVTSVDIDSVYWFYLLQASTAAAPAKPTTVPATKGNAPSGWTTAEPTTVDINKTLYRVELTYFTDGTGVYSSVNKVSSYEAAKVAYNKATDVQTNLDNLEMGGANLWFNSQEQKADSTQWVGNLDEIVSTDLPNSSEATFKIRGTKETKYYVPYDPSKKYKCEAWVKATDSYKTNTGNAYPSIMPYDMDKNLIGITQVYQKASSLTTLARDLNPGDTVIYATDLSGWETGDSYYNYVGIYNYESSSGYKYDRYTRYTPQFADKGSTKTNINKTNNTITLKSAYTGPKALAGTQISQHTAGSTYIYPFGGFQYQSVANWVNKTNTFNSSMDPRLPHASYIRFYSYTSALWYFGLSLTDVTDAEAAKDAATAASNAQSTANSASTAAATAQATADAKKSMIKINAPAKSLTTANWKTYGAAGHSESWTTGSSYSNPDIKVGDTAYIVGTVTDGAKGSATVIGTVTAVNGTNGTTSIVMTSQQLIFGGDSVDNVNTTANTAKTTADEAKTAATTATNTANTAKTAADNALINTKYNGPVNIGAAVTANRLIMNTTTAANTAASYKMVAKNTAYNIESPILYSATALSTGNIALANHTCYLIGNVSITGQGGASSLTVNKPVFLKGTLSGSTFTTVNDATFITQTQPTSSDNYHYIFLGTATSTTNVMLQAEHPIYMFIGGSFHRLGSSSDKILQKWVGSATAAVADAKLNGSYIQANTVTSEHIYVEDLNALDATIGGFTIGKTSNTESAAVHQYGLYFGSIGSDNSVALLPQGTTTSVTIGSHEGTDWRITAGSKFGVTAAGNLYAADAYLSNATISGTVTATYGKIGKWNIVNNLVTVQTAAGAPEGSLCYKKAGTEDSICLVAGGTLPRNVTIAGYSRNDWKVMVGNAFGIKANGDVVATNAVFKESVVAYGSLAAELLSTTGTLKDQISNSDISVYSWDHFVFFSGDGISVANFSTYIQTWCNGSSSGQSGDWRIKDGWRPIKNVWFPFIYSHNGFRTGCMQIRADGYINAYIYPTYGSGAKDMKTEYRNNNTTNITGSDSLFFNASWIRA